MTTDIITIHSDNSDILYKPSKLFRCNRDLAPLGEIIDQAYKYLENPAHNAVGLAAPQIGNEWSWFIAKINNEIHFFSNPRIIGRMGNVSDIEGCLSIPNAQYNVRRPKSIILEHGIEIIERDKFEGYDARIICHEVAHLTGKLISLGNKKIL